MRRSRRGIAVGVCAAVLAAGTFQLQTGSASAAATKISTTLTCSPSDPAVAKAVADNAALIAGIAPGLDLSALALPATVEADVPTEMAPGDSAPISFSWDVQLTTQIVGLLTTAGLKTITVDNISLPVNAVQKGATVTSVPGTRDALSLALTAGQAATVTGGPFTGELTDVQGGQIKYSSTGGGFSVKGDLTGSPLLAAVKGALPALFPAGDNVLTLAQTCTTNAFATTTVTAVGAPIIDPVIDNTAVASGTGTSLDLSTHVKPGTYNGAENPVDWSTLALTGDTAGFTLDGKTIKYAGSTTPGDYTVNFTVCGAEVELSPAVAAVDEVQRIAMQDDYGFTAGANLLDNLNKPIYFTLKIDGVETRAIQTTALRDGTMPANFAPFDLLARFAGLDLRKVGTYDYAKGLTDDGKPIPAGNELGALAQLWADNLYKAPTVAEIQAQVDAAIGVGKITVTESATPGDFPAWDFNYTGALGDKDVPQVEIGQWVTFPPQDILTSLLALVNGGGSGGGGGLPPLDSWKAFFGGLIPAPTPTGNFLVDGPAKLLYDGLIDQLSTFAASTFQAPTPNELVKKVLDWFPKKPAVTTPIQGAEAVAAQMSGPLCTEASWTVTVADSTTTTTVAPTTTTPGSTTTTPAAPTTTAPRAPTTTAAAAVAGRTISRAATPIRFTG